jgi:tRNA (guanine37-N1)-methyltransferase
MSPKGETLRQQKVFQLLEYEHLILLCGHYEGVDQRVIDLFIDEEISIGDYVLTGGELPAMVLTDCVSRYVDGVISASSLVDESFSDNLLEYPQYTRPQEYKGLAVPEVLRSGNHAKIDEWRREKSLEITAKRRPDLLKKEEL